MITDPPSNLLTPPIIPSNRIIAPRRDHVEYDDDLAEALVTVTVQTSSGYRSLTHSHHFHWPPNPLDHIF